MYTPTHALNQKTQNIAESYGGAENDGHEIAGHEIDGRENAGHEIARHEIARHLELCT